MLRDLQLCDKIMSQTFCKCTIRAESKLHTGQTPPPVSTTRDGQQLSKVS